MININHYKVEKFYDYLDEAALYLFEQTKNNYLDSLLIASDYVLSNDETLNKLEDSIIDGLDKIYLKIDEESFNIEEIRKAFQLSLLKAFKHLNLNISEITPDSIGMLFSYFIDLFFKNQKQIDVLDANVGCGNLLFSMTNNSNKDFKKIYGIDILPTYLNIAMHLANLMEYEVEFFNQNNLSKLLVPQVDLIISDLPTDFEDNVSTFELVTSRNNINYKPYLMIENLMSYGKEGSYFIYLIPRDFFIQKGNEIIKEIILKESHIQAIIELPLDMFKESVYQKSILILRKRGSNISINNEILMLKFPSFKEKDKVKIALNKINEWYNKNHKL